MDNGHQFVTMDGTIVMLRLCVDNLGLVQQEVSTHTLYIYMYTVSTCKELRPIIHDAIWLHVIYMYMYKSQCVYYKITQSYIAYDVSHRIELLFILDDMTKLYATKSQRV